MSKNRMVNTKFWSDSFVVDKLNALDRYLFLYLLTNEHSNMIGIYELPLRIASFETGIEKDDLTSMIKRLSPKVEFFNGWVYVRRFTDHQNVNPNIEKGMMKAVFALPTSVIKQVISLGIESPKLVKYFESLTKAFESNTKQFAKPELKLEPEPEPNSKPKGLLVKSDKPTTRMSTKQFFYELIKNLGFTEQVKATDGRIAKLKCRLNNFSTAELLTAASNLAKDSYMQGDNQSGKRYGTIDYLIRNDENVDKYLTSPTKAKHFA